MPRRDIVVVGASAGGIEALRAMLGTIPGDLDGVVLIVLHLAPGGGGALPAILDRAGPLEVQAALDGEPLKTGRVYAAVADHHLLVGNGHVHVRRGPKENGHRPAVDPLFRSAARYYGPRVTGVVLSGTLSDGTAGLQAIRRQGGVAVVQDPSDALYDGMPTSALHEVGADHIVAAVELGPLLDRLVREEVPEEAPVPDETLRKEVAVVERTVEEPPVGARPSSWPCPDCNGVLWEIDDEEVLRFRCRVGHAWGAESLLEQQGSAVEAALWIALRSLEDRVALSRALAERAETTGKTLSAARYRSGLDDMVKSMEILRRLVATDEVQDAFGGETGA
jgi:two-component system chemotaxis response regulator CheB